MGSWWYARRDAEQQLGTLRERATELERLQATSDSLARVIGVGEALHLIVESLVSLGYCFAAFLTLDAEKQVLTDYVLSTGRTPPSEEAQRIIPLSAEIPLTRENHPAVQCVRTLKVQTTQDLAEITVPIIEPASARDVQRGAGVKSIAVVPVLVGGQPFGVWIAGSDRKERLDEADLRTLVTFANQAGLAIERARLYDHLRQEKNASEMALQELRATQDQLVRSERLSSMGRLAASIAHEVNNPLQSVRTCLELTLEELELGRAVDHENVVIAHREIERVSQIVRRLLNLQRPGEERESLVKVNVAVGEVLDLLGKQFSQAHVSVTSELDPELPLVRGRNNHLIQVFLNLALNALEAMPDGGELRVTTARMPSQWVAVTFTDTGVGIPAPNLPHVFEPFFSTKPNGLGLGLAVSLTIVEAHGGRIAVASEPGRGASCRVEIPAYGGEVSAYASPSSDC